ncbi:MAG: methylated-DNA--[protein]-cysteine S-methyltransferase [Lautropia sp.]|nr:methylated-DNA--[protein]-cysteine S-methyltransferase [Lautropia sp.]
MNPMPPSTYFTHIPSPVGSLMIAAASDGLRAVEFPESRHPVPRHGTWHELAPEALVRWAARTDGLDGASALASPDQPPCPDDPHPSRPAAQHTPPEQVIRHLIDTRQQLDEYFAGRRQQFELPLAPQGTPFQQQVWQALRDIPYGQTWHYGQLARHIGNPRSVRAVGAANGRNPIAIIIPCHRVIGANGALVGFGGGLRTKARLLALESAQQSLSPISDA